MRQYLPAISFFRVYVLDLLIRRMDGESTDATKLLNHEAHKINQTLLIPGISYLVASVHSPPTSQNEGSSTYCLEDKLRENKQNVLCIILKECVRCKLHWWRKINRTLVKLTWPILHFVNTHWVVFIILKLLLPYITMSTQDLHLNLS